MHELALGHLVCAREGQRCVWERHGSLTLTEHLDSRLTVSTGSVTGACSVNRQDWLACCSEHVNET